MSRPPALLLAVAVASVVSGCAAAPTGPTAEEGGPLLALPECQSPPPRAPDSEIQGIEFPEGAVVTSVERGDPLTSVRGFVAQTPVEVRRYYQSRTDLEILNIEDEIVEAEVMVGNGTHRTYVKAQAVCQTGSQLLGVVAPELDAEGLPVPAGGASPSRSRSRSPSG